jgi:hypothetical protein
VARSEDIQLAEGSASSDDVFEVEVLPPDAGVEIDHAVGLTGEQARAMTDLVTGLTKTGWQLGRRARKQTYRLVPPERLAEGLRDRSLRLADATKGDASVLIKSTETGRIAGHGRLQKVKVSKAKVFGPAVWEVMAMASQQHYLVEISAKLSALQHAVDELLERVDDEKVGLLRKATKVADDAISQLAEGGTVSQGRRRELQDQAHKVDETWHELLRRVTRQLDAYKQGTEKAETVAESFALLLLSSRALAECSGVLTQLPYTTRDEQRGVWREEHARIVAAGRELRDVAEGMQAAHILWSDRKAARELVATKNPVRFVNRKARRELPRKPKQHPLDDGIVAQCSALTAPPARPTMLLQIAADGSVRVGTEKRD